MSDPAGRPTSVVDVGAEGTVGPDRQTFTAAGIGEIDGSGGEVLVTHHAAVHATRADAG